MRFVDDFFDYEVLDCGDGYKIEKFGKYILKRPDPQAIWKMKNENFLLDAIYHRSNSGGGYWEFKNKIDPWKITYKLDNEKIMVFNLKPFSFKHTGVFPEQAVNWKEIYNKIKNIKNCKVLNLFAYTGGATIASALAGAIVTHVDSSKGIITWAHENANDSNVSFDKIRWIVDDCRKFVLREIKRGNKYNAIILDPPSFGRGLNGEVWKLENDLYDFLLLLREIVLTENSFVVLNSYTTGLQSLTLNYLLSDVFKSKFGGTVDSYELGLKVKSTNLLLPEGTTGIWNNIY